MAGRITSTCLERIKEASNIVDIVSGYVTLKRSGRAYKGLCPFHDEKTPSFSVTPDRGWFHCFGCGEKGSAIDFVMAMDRVDFVEAVEFLADRSGIEIEREVGEAPKPSHESAKSDVFRVNAWAAKFFQKQLTLEKGQGCRDYLDGRKLSRETWAEFKIGYAPDAWTELADAARARGIPDRLLLDAGLAKQREGKSGVYDAFRDRLIFPIFDALDRVIGFGGRSLDGSEPKYLNSPKTPVFNKSASLYGLDRLRRLKKDEEIFVMEGYTDVIMAVQQAQMPAVATLGTALTPQHARLLGRYTEQITLVYDGDAAGRKAAERGAELFTAIDLDLKVARLAAKQDPCDFLAERGIEGLEAIRASAMPFFDFVLGEVCERHDLNDVVGKVKAADELLKLAHAASNPIKRGLILDRIAHSLSLSRSDLESRSLGTTPKYRAPTGEEDRPTKKTIVAQEPDRPVTRARRRAERHVLQALVNGAGAGSAWHRELLEDDFSTGAGKRLFSLLAAKAKEGAGVGFDTILLGIEDSGDREFVKNLVIADEPSESLPIQLAGGIKHLLECRHERELNALKADGVNEDNFAVIFQKMKKAQNSDSETVATPKVNKPPQFAAPKLRKEEETPVEAPWEEESSEPDVGFDDDDMF